MLKKETLAKYIGKNYIVSSIYHFFTNKRDFLFQEKKNLFKDMPDFKVF